MNDTTKGASAQVELMNCPFCGGDAVVIEAESGYYAACNSADNTCDVALGYDECHDCSYGAFDSREEAAAAWNRRA